jgi:hypothetical protein
MSFCGPCQQAINVAHEIICYFMGCFRSMKICENLKKKPVEGDFFVGFYWPTK